MNAFKTSTDVIYEEFKKWQQVSFDLLFTLSNLFRANFHRQNAGRFEKQKILNRWHRLSFLAVDNVFEQKSHENVEESLEQVRDDLSERPRLFYSFFVVHVEFLVFEVIFAISNEVFQSFFYFFVVDYHWA